MLSYLHLSLVYLIPLFLLSLSRSFFLFVFDFFPWLFVYFFPHGYFHHLFEHINPVAFLRHTFHMLYHYFTINFALFCLLN